MGSFNYTQGFWAGNLFFAPSCFTVFKKIYPLPVSFQLQNKVEIIIYTNYNSPLKYFKALISF